MSTTETLGVLGFGFAVISLVWQVRVQRVLLRVRIDDEGSGFTTLRLSPRSHIDALFHPELRAPELRTGVHVLLSVANTSQRPNTVVAIEATAHLPLEPVPGEAAISAGRRSVEHIFGEGRGRDLDVAWVRGPDWKTPYALSPGDRHEAGLSFLLAGEVRAPSHPMPIKVCVEDTYGRRYRRTARLTHRSTSGPHVTPVGEAEVESRTDDSR